MKSLATLTLVLALVGCGGSSTPPGTPPVTNTDQAARNAEIIRVATAQAVALGLNVYAGQGHNADAMVVAQKVKDLVATTALPYLTGASGATSAAVNGFLNGQFVNLPSIAQDFISLSAMVLDHYLPAPSADSILDATQLSYITAFFNGLNDGATQFIANPPAVKPVPSPKIEHPRSTAAWFNVSKP